MTAEQLFTEFLGFCDQHLHVDESNRTKLNKGSLDPRINKMTLLVKKRYKDCDPDYRSGEDFIELIKSTKKKMQSDSVRTFVHLRDFMNTLKAHRTNKDTKSIHNSTNGSKEASGHDGQKKGNKRRLDSEERDEPPKKLARHEVVIDLSSDEADESHEMFAGSDEENEFQVIGSSHSGTTSNKHKQLENKHSKNTSGNWEQFRFKQPVMASIAAAASSFSSRLSKTIEKAGSGHLTPERNTDHLETHILSSDSSISSTSRSPSPELPEFDDSCAILNEQKPEENDTISGFVNDKYNADSEALRSSEISSTTSNVDLEEYIESKIGKSSSKQTCDNSGIPHKSFSSKNKVCTSSEVQIKDLEEDIDDYIVEMNVSSDEESGCCDKDEQSTNNAEYKKGKTGTCNVNDTTVNFISRNKNRESSCNINEETIDYATGNKSKSSTLKSKEHADEESIKAAAKINNKTSNDKLSEKKRISSSKIEKQEPVILLESDDESSSDEKGDVNARLLEKREEKDSTKAVIDMLFGENETPKSEKYSEQIKEGENTESDGTKNTKENIMKETKVSGVKEKDNNSSVSSMESISLIENDIQECEKTNEPLAVSESVAVDKLNDEEEKEKAKSVDVDPSTSNGSNKEKKDLTAVLGLVATDKAKKTEFTKDLNVFPSTSSDKTEGKANTQLSKDEKEVQGKTKSGKKGSKRQIEELESLLKKIRDKIEQIRSRELSLDEMDDEASDYILEDKLQKKFVAVWTKLCLLHKQAATTGRPTQKMFRYEGTRYPEVNRIIEKFINKRKTFPDYRDIRKLIVKVNRDHELKLRSKAIDDLAREAFTDVGNQLQDRRQKDFVSNINTPFQDTVSTYDDPALYDPELKKKLEVNRKVSKSQMDKVVEKYTQLQYNVGDKEASEDETADSTDDVSEKMDTDAEVDELSEEADGLPVEGLDISSTACRALVLRESSQVEIVNDEVEDIGPYLEDTQIDRSDSPIRSGEMKDVSLNDKMEDEASSEDNHALNEENHALNEDDHALKEDDHALKEDDHALKEDDHALNEDDLALNEDENDRTLKEADYALDEDDHAFDAHDDHASNGDDQTSNEDDYEKETLRSETESSLSPDGVKREMDKVLDIFDEEDGVVEMVSDDSDSDEQASLESSTSVISIKQETKMTLSDKTSTEKLHCKKDLVNSPTTSEQGDIDIKDEQDSFDILSLEKHVKESSNLDLESDEDQPVDKHSISIFPKSVKLSDTHNNTETVSGIELDGFQNLKDTGASSGNSKSIDVNCEESSRILHNTETQENTCTDKFAHSNQDAQSDTTKTSDRTENETESVVILDSPSCESEHVDKIPTFISETEEKSHTVNSQTDKECLSENDESDVEIVDEYNVNDPYAEEKDSHDTYSSHYLDYEDTTFSSQNLDREQYSAGDTLEIDDENDPQLNSQDLSQPDEYETEISSTLSSSFDIKAPVSIMKESVKAPSVKLVKPREYKSQKNKSSNNLKGENLDLIEMYVEPDSTLYLEDTTDVSSSGRNEIIVLSDSE